MDAVRRKKLEELLKLKAASELRTADELLRDCGHTGINRVPAAVKPEPIKPVSLIEAAPGVELALDLPDGTGRLWLIRQTLEQFAPDSRDITRQYASVLRGAGQSFDELSASAEVCHAANAEPESLLFMDTETCGLAGCAIFLVGVMFYERQVGDLVFEQYFARDYSEEPAILQRFLERYAQTGVLVTFNGKAFDMTMIRERAAFHGLEMPWAEPPHMDLLHESRKLWRGRLPNCRLQTLERALCGRFRTGDIPGSAIPDAYHRFVATGDARQVRDILHHNVLDMLTMAQLVSFVLTGRDPLDAQ